MKLHALFVIVAFTLTACVVKKSTYQKALDELTVTGQKLDRSEQDRSRQANDVKRLEGELSKSRRASASFTLAKQEHQLTVERLQLELSHARLKAKLLTKENEVLRKPPAKPPKTTKAKQAARIRELENQVRSLERLHKLAMSKVEALLKRERERIRRLQKVLQENPVRKLK